jgi:N-acetylglucosaminyldiphosphoundecaprenol N-acetyl-beta-D-mannosaminyltransferase
MTLAAVKSAPYTSVPFAEAPHTISVRGVDLNEVTSPELTSYLITSSKSGRGGVLLTPNLDALRLVAKSPEAAAIVSSADLRVADGVPVLWLSRLQGTPLPERVAGSDLTVKLATALADAQLSVFLLGGDPGTADGAARRLRELNPGLKVAGTYCPPHGYENDPEAIAEIIGQLAEARPDFVYVGLPFLKAAKLARQISVALPTSWSLGVGVSFSFLTGDVRRAPVWMQRSGLEWMHRMVQEPQRLFRRYILEDLPFLLKAAPGAFRERLRRRPKTDTIVVHHFGPYLGEVGGMASVIQTLSGEHVGADVTYVHSTRSERSRLRTLYWTVGAALAIARLPRTAVVHLHMSEGGSFLREGCLGTVARCLRRPTVVTLHGADFDESASKHPGLLRWALRAPGAITCLDRRHVPRIEDLAPRPRVSHVPTPVAIPADVADAGATEPIVLFVGEVSAHNGADVLSEAWPVVRSAVPDARCILIGPATSLVLEPQDGLEIRSPASPDQIADLLRRCRCVALPLRAGTLPMMLLDAMAAARPFVSTPVGGIPALSQGGVLVPVGDASALADAVIRLLADPDAAGNLGRAGQNYCEQAQSIGVIDARLRDIYGELIRG